MAQYTKREIRQAFGEVQGHVLHLHAYWRIYRKLFRGNKYSAPILGAVAPQVFAVLDKALPRIIFLIFRQLTDQPKSMGKSNASLRGLLSALAGDDYQSEHEDLVALIDRIEGSKSMRDHANRYMAHIDFDLAAGKAAVPEDVDLLAIEEALGNAREFMNGFAHRFFAEPAFDYENPAIGMLAQLDDMIETIRIGLEAQGRTPSGS